MATIVKRTYRAKLPDGTVETRELSHWTIEYRDANGKRCRVKGYKDRAATKQLAAKLELAEARGEVGMLNPHKASFARAVTEHIGEYIANLRATGRSDEYAYIAKQRLDRIVQECGWDSLKQIDANSFIRWREAAKDNPRPMGFRTIGKKRTASAETLNQYLDTARAFTNWCATNGRMPGVPSGNGKMVAVALAGVGKVDGADRRLRRALSDENVVKLLGAVPPDRAMIYRFGVTTGLRRSELEQLAWGDLRMRSTKPYIQLRGETTKAGRDDRLPLPVLLVEELRKMKPAGASDAARVFPVVPGIEIWKADLELAGIPYLDDMGRQADFHAGTRKTLATRMHRNNVPLAVAMRMMRHTDSRLTLVDYTDSEQLGMSDVMDTVPELVAPAKVQAAAG